MATTKAKKLRDHPELVTKNKKARWVDRWRLRKIIAMLCKQTELGSTENVYEFAKSLEATEIMTRNLKPDTEVVINITRGQLESFIRYMANLHETKISRLNEARIGLAVLACSDEHVLQQKPRELLKEEATRTLKSKHPKIARVI